MRKLLLVGLAVAAPVLFASGASACGWGCDCAPSYGYSYGYSAPRVYGYSSYGYASYRIQQLRIRQLLPSGVRICQLLRSGIRIRRLLPSRRALLWCADVRLAWWSGRP